MISPHTEKVLEYDKLKVLLKQHAHSQLGASRAAKLKPFQQLDAVRYQQRLCSEAKAFYQTSNGFPLQGLKDISPTLYKVSKPGAILEVEELLGVARVAEAAQNVQRAVKRRNPKDFPKLFSIVRNLPIFPELTQSIDRCLSPDGDVLDHASPALRAIRRKLVHTRTNIQSKLEGILQSPHHQRSIQEHLITSRNDRYVIPIKQDSKHNFPGVVQGQSSSGATAFIEPFGVVDLNNELHQLADEERQEIRRILLELSDSVREHLSSLGLALDILGGLDFLGAKARLSIELNGVEPVLNVRGAIKLIEARHPLLEMNLRDSAKLKEEERDPNLPERIVPTDATLGDMFHTMVITGPNTGGKTVVLKTVGLLTLMAQSGLHIPAKMGSEVGIFDQMFADIGDEQSIEQNLSTFSSHVTKIVDILERIGDSPVEDNSLVLLDEIGAGTEPTEGAALGMSILDWLVEQKARTIVTTHYGALKVYAHTREEVENASMEFDGETLSPTYRLLIGVPGSSNAMKIAQRLGVPDKILAAAKAQIGNQNIAVEDLILSMQHAQRELEVERRIVQEKIQEAEAASKKHQEMIRQLKSERDQLKRQAEKDAFEVVNDARRLVDRTVADLRHQQASKTSIKTAFANVDNAKEELKKRSERSSVPSKPPKPLPEIKVGDKVRVKNLNRFAEVISITEKNSKKPLKIQVGSMQMQVAFRDIEDVQPQANNPNLSTSVLDIQYSKATSVKNELHLRGKTVSETLEEADKYLDDALLAGLPVVRIIHGKGTGTLRKAIHDFLGEHPLVTDFRLAARNEGAEGATVVTLKE
jgi:DNA mismatch repair protein MutS2